MSTDLDRQRLLDLLADRALFGLSPAEVRELANLEPMFSDVDTQEMDRIVGLLESNPITPSDEMPSAIKQRVLQDGQQFSQEQTKQAKSVTTPVPTSKSTSRTGRDLWIGILASAATLLIAGLAFWEQDLTTIELRDQVIASAPTDLIRLDWTSTDETKSYGGDVVWSDELQRGYMTFRGLPQNDPTQEQYQLWIFDADQKEATPIDGGVFDVDGDDVVVEIDAKLAVNKPSLFAITIEKPGGVVVSERLRLPLVAPVP